jgi:hypothetical protein
MLGNTGSRCKIYERIDALDRAQSVADLVDRLKPILNELAYCAVNGEAAVLATHEEWHTQYTDELYSQASSDFKAASAARGDAARGDAARGDTARGDAARGGAARGAARPARSAPSTRRSAPEHPPEYPSGRPREHPPREYPPREYPPREYSPREYSPREYPLEYPPGDRPKTRHTVQAPPTNRPHPGATPPSLRAIMNGTFKGEY